MAKNTSLTEKRYFIDHLQRNIQVKLDSMKPILREAERILAIKVREDLGISQMYDDAYALNIAAEELRVKLEKLCIELQPIVGSYNHTLSSINSGILNKMKKEELDKVIRTLPEGDKYLELEKLIADIEFEIMMATTGEDLKQIIAKVIQDNGLEV